MQNRHLRLMQAELLELAARWRWATPLTRRQLLSSFVGTAGALAASTALGRRVQDSCLITPPQTEGPFYPVHDQADKDNDLTLVRGAPGRASGRILYLVGQVKDRLCRPVDGALVEIWQANASGRYNHPDDRNERARLDPNFQHWGLHRTDQKGWYRFKTIIPAPYPVGFFWTRPAHIHFRVHRRGFPDLTTQMYFAGDPYLERDRIFSAIPPAQQPRVVVTLEPSEAGSEPAARRCRFDLTVP